MAKASAAITSPKVKKLAKKAVTSPSMLTTLETRELGASVVAFLSPPKETALSSATKATTKRPPATTGTSKKSSRKMAIRTT